MPTNRSEYRRAYYLAHKERAREIDRAWRKMNAHKKKEYNETPKAKFTAYKLAAVKRGYAFKLKQAEFISLLHKPCHYCNNIATGLDRVNNKKGYLSSNVVPCCKLCNFMKGKMEQEEFIKQCKLIIGNL